MRNAKDGNTRKNEILDIALALFGEKGYEKTTVEDILNRAGISKGAFYYYFETKEDVLRVLTMREVAKKIELTKKIVEDESLSAIDKLNKLIDEAQKINFAGLENRMKLYKAVKEYGNLELQQRMLDNGILLGTPLIQRILEQGIAEKTMNTDFPEEAAGLYIEMMNQYKAAIAKIWTEFEDKARVKTLLKKKTRFYQCLFERILEIKADRLLFLAIAAKYIDQL
jgi:AcrR family transcriptional regulator